ncbi:MAG: FtsX-like permease family protein [Bacteroidia bacterium]|nr:FtsX-like permease family protein [Bacteroidia bacterium]
MLLKLAWRNLWRNKRRTLITTASIFVAVILSTFMRSLQEGSYNEMIKNAVSFYSGYIQIHQNGYWDEQKLDNSFEDIELIKTALSEEQRVTVATPRIESALLISSGEKTHIAQIVGTEPEQEDQLTNLAEKVVEGRYLTSDDRGLMIAQGIAEKLKVGVGDSLILLGQGYHGVSANEIYPIIGIVKYASPLLNKRIMFLPLKEAQEMFVAHERLTSYAINVENPKQSESVAQALKAELDSEAYEVMPWTELSPDLIKMIEGDRAGGYLFMAILYVIIGFGIFGTALMMINERQYEFGVMTAIGMKKGKLAQLLTLEMVIMAILGVIAGFVAAIPIITYFQINPITFEGEAAKAYEAFNIAPIIPTALDMGVIASQALVVLIITLLISIYPILQLLRLDPIKAMRT